MTDYGSAGLTGPMVDTSIFKIQLRSGIWNVKLNGVFRGDYRGLSIALESIQKKVLELRVAGYSVHILTLSAGGAILNSTIAAAI